MDLPLRIKEIILTLYTAHRDLAERDDDSRRLLARLVAEQCCFELGPRWGLKATSRNNPQGQSQLAFDGPEGLVGWRWQDNDGSVTKIKNAPIPNPPMQSFAGQFFIAVDAINHLAESEPAPDEPPAPQAPDATAQAVLDAIARLEKTVSHLEVTLVARMKAQKYQATVRAGWPLGTVSVTLEPEP